MSALAYVIAVALHEHGGHASVCLLLGSHPKELGAFYVDCDSAALSSLGMRLVALAGPVASLITGVVAFSILPRLPARQPLAYYFTWLLGGLGLMSAAGYPLFSGFSGLGDLGTTRDGALFEAAPEWLWRAALVVGGLAAYAVVVRHMCRSIAPYAGAVGSPQLTVARRSTLLSYVTGAAVYLAIGAFNPMGWTIVLLSVLPSSLGGTCGLLWMWSPYRRLAPASTAGHGIGFARSGWWISLSVLIVLAYAVVFGPSIHASGW